MTLPPKQQVHELPEQNFFLAKVLHGLLMGMQLPPLLSHFLEVFWQTPRSGNLFTDLTKLLMNVSAE